MTIVKFDEFRMLDFRVGQVESAEKVANTDRLIRMIINIGGEKRQVIAGIGNSYAPEQLTGRKLMVLVNLEHKKFKGLESEAMLLAADWEDGTSVIFVGDDVPIGTRVV
ncbi:MAG: methionine--tRNA ligase subunit beta [Candidatus Micrarchaeota archaeon]|nr:methionine--tRNA ligase subunit beta [Candidatus Micrarchaeota archaeon]